jgi:hypothetical protein
MLAMQTGYLFSVMVALQYLIQVMLVVGVHSLEWLFCVDRSRPFDSLVFLYKQRG